MVSLYRGHSIRKRGLNTLFIQQNTHFDVLQIEIIIFRKLHNFDRVDSLLAHILKFFFS